MSSLPPKTRKLKKLAESQFNAKARVCSEWRRNQVIIKRQPFQDAKRIQYINKIVWVNF